jgi:hypothetical protein
MSTTWADLLKRSPEKPFETFEEYRKRVRQAEITRLKLAREKEERELKQLVEKQRKELVDGLESKDSVVDLDEKIQKTILNFFAEKARKTYHADQMARGKHYSCYPVMIESVYLYIDGARSVKEIVTDDIGYGHCDRHVIVSVPYDGVKYYVIWHYRSGSCSFCDDDRFTYDTISKFQREKEKVISKLADDLVEKIMSGKVYSSLSALGRDLRSDSWYSELYDKLTGRFNEKKKEEKKEDFKIPEPCPAVAAMIEAKKSATLRDILTTMGMMEVPTEKAMELGLFLKSRLKSRHREKKEVVRGEQTYSVLLYEPNEFAMIEYLIRLKK